MIKIGWFTILLTFFISHVVDTTLTFNQSENILKFILDLTFFFNSPGDLSAPVSATRLWSNKGSTSLTQVAVYRLLAPYGYRCLGMVAGRGFHEKPNLTMYR